MARSTRCSRGWTAGREALRQLHARRLSRGIRRQRAQRGLGGGGDACPRCARPASGASFFSERSDRAIRVRFADSRCIRRQKARWSHLRDVSPSRKPATASPSTSSLRATSARRSSIARGRSNARAQSARSTGQLRRRRRRRALFRRRRTRFCHGRSDRSRRRPAKRRTRYRTKKLRPVMSPHTMRDDTNEHQAFALPGARPQYGPDKLVAVEHIDLHLTPDFEDQSLDGICTMTVRALDEPVPRLVLDAVDLDVSRVDQVSSGSKQSRSVRFTPRERKLEIEFDPPIAPGERARSPCTIACPSRAHGLFFVKPTAEHPEKIAHLWTQSQDQYARYWFPCLDYPHEKQPTSTTIVVPKGMFALGNGELIERRDPDGRTIFRYRQDVAAQHVPDDDGRGAVRRGRAGSRGSKRGSGLLLRAAGARGRRRARLRQHAEDARALRRAHRRRRIRTRAIRRSPFRISSSAAWRTRRRRRKPIERSTTRPRISIFRAIRWSRTSSRISGSAICLRAAIGRTRGSTRALQPSWRPSGAKPISATTSIATTSSRGCSAYLKEDSERYRRPIVCNAFRDPIEIFDRHLYQKGAAVLHMLRGELGEARFWRAIATLRSPERAAKRRDDRSRARHRRSDGTQPARLLQPMGLSRGPSKAGGARGVGRRPQGRDANHRSKADDRCGASALRVRRRDRRSRGAIEGAAVRAHVAATARNHDGSARFRAEAGALRSRRLYLGRRHLCARHGPCRGDVRAAIPTSLRGFARRASWLRTAGASRATPCRARFAHEPFWGVLAEAAAAIGATRAPWARAILLEALAHPHPKVVRAAAAALGNFRDAAVAAALIAAAQQQASYFVRAAALTALGKTRDDRAFDVLAAAAQRETWNWSRRGRRRRRSSRAGRSPRAAASDRCDPTRNGTRLCGARRSRRWGASARSWRTSARASSENWSSDSTTTSFLVSIHAIAAAESLGDARLLPALDRLSDQALDGRHATRRDGSRHSHPKGRQGSRRR